MQCSAVVSPVEVRLDGDIGEAKAIGPVLTRTGASAQGPRQSIPIVRGHGPRHDTPHLSADSAGRIEALCGRARGAARTSVELCTQRVGVGTVNAGGRCEALCDGGRCVAFDDALSGGPVVWEHDQRRPPHPPQPQQPPQQQQPLSGPPLWRPPTV
jgi:hypothetical protein